MNSVNELVQASARRQAVGVRVGNVVIGGSAPVIVQ